jgi:hypothetical protein
MGKRLEPCRLPIDLPEDEAMRISHEAIYQALFVQGRGALRRELTACLRTGRALRMPRARTRRRGKTFISPEIMISQRPAEAADRAVPGHWEGDLILGLGSSATGEFYNEMVANHREEPGQPVIWEDALRGALACHASALRFRSRNSRLPATQKKWKPYFTTLIRRVGTNDMIRLRSELANTKHRQMSTR